ncbi:ABC-type bacteriocin/lantibiotic exporter, contains an N-terminal double-glycine peptidase domain [Paramicrobacterium humi]|uniref:ABC-type bacteriocin/lantibiotic exporter, contains an N-terminal double-glycine peptidase domain n=1 Tax=Paramicrobacterium humi TaxID=640635 RepID=A0A1H4IU61_9MICO|nr:ABC-type bacteriocin/lantibiotic exporter, contains an N-terminal double-glycine peptidase domain [Microbacterium humi]
MKLIWDTMRSIVPLLPGRARRFLIAFMIISSALAVLDVAALMLLAISLTSMMESDPISIPLLGTVGPDGYVWVVLVISLLIILKSVLSVILQWIATRRFAVYELEIGDKLFDAYIKAPWVERLNRNTAQLVRLADVGIANAIAGFLLPVIGIPQLLITSVVVLAVIVVAQPLTALVTVVYLGLIAGVLYFWMSKKSVQAGRVGRDYAFKVASLMTDMVAALKEVTLRNKTAEVARVVHDNRIHSTRARANVSFLGTFPKFVLDSALIGGFLLVGGSAYLFGGSAAAISAVAMFGVGGFRLVPSLTGFQSVITIATSNVAHVQNVLDDIAAAESYVADAERIGMTPIEGEPRALELSNVQFTYPNAGEAALRDIDLRLPIGSTLAFVGQSGSGKSTLVDLILGLLTPSSGSVKLDDQDLADVLAAWRSRVGYVPQDVALFDGTIAQNVALTWGDDIDEARVETALRRAQLWNVVQQRPGGIRSRVGDRGLSLSGGQRQRLGIARALYGDPLVLVLDEATSALDTKTEADVTESIAGLKGQVTLITVAHRLSTVREHDQICYLADGQIVARGTFPELVAKVPEFAVQASLAGLA